MTRRAFEPDVDAVVLDVDGVLPDTAAAHAAAPVRQAVGTVRDHRDLLRRSGLRARPDTVGRERP